MGETFDEGMPVDPLTGEQVVESDSGTSGDDRSLEHTSVAEDGTITSNSPVEEVVTPGGTATENPLQLSTGSRPDISPEELAELGQMDPSNLTFETGRQGFNRGNDAVQSDAWKLVDSGSPQAHAHHALPLLSRFSNAQTLSEEPSPTAKEIFTTNPFRADHLAPIAGQRDVQIGMSSDAYEVFRSMDGPVDITEYKYVAEGKREGPLRGGRRERPGTNLGETYHALCQGPLAEIRGLARERIEGRLDGLPGDAMDKMPTLREEVASVVGHRIEAVRGLKDEYVREVLQGSRDPITTEGASGPYDYALAARNHQDEVERIVGEAPRQLAGLKVAS